MTYFIVEAQSIVEELKMFLASIRIIWLKFPIKY